jgi:hypothetical protein
MGGDCINSKRELSKIKKRYKENSEATYQMVNGPSSLGCELLKIDYPTEISELLEVIKSNSKRIDKELDKLYESGVNRELLINYVKNEHTGDPTMRYVVGLNRDLKDKNEISIMRLDRLILWIQRKATNVVRSLNDLHESTPDLDGISEIKNTIMDDSEEFGEIIEDIKKDVIKTYGIEINPYADTDEIIRYTTRIKSNNKEIYNRLDNLANLIHDKAVITLKDFTKLNKNLPPAS